jgi:hypothetical protein
MRLSILLGLLLFLGCNPKQASIYSVPDQPWPDTFGSHRAVIEVKTAVPAVKLDFLWRRHDRFPEKKQFIIVHAESGDTIQNIHRLAVNNERCELVFGPVDQAGTYHFYYLPYVIQENYGFYNKGYLRPEQEADRDWKNAVMSGGDKLLKATLKSIQARTQFDSFYPMEVIPTKEEKDRFLADKQSAYLLFPEGREHPIRMLDEIPHKWVKKELSNMFHGEALKDEYYAFQIGVFAHQQDLKDVKVEFSELRCDFEKIEASRLTCFNTGGIDPFGKEFTKQVDVTKGMVQPLWMGIDISRDLKPGTYTGQISIKPSNAPEQLVQVNIDVKNEVIEERGDNEPWRHSRLRWLNSTRGIDDEPTADYQSIKPLGDRRYDFSGKVLGMASTGMPGSMSIYGTEILASPMQFVVEERGGQTAFSEPQDVKLMKNADGVMQGAWTSLARNIEMQGVGTIEADGYLHFELKLKALEAVNLKDVRLEIPMKTEVAQYMMGMGLPGCETPAKHQAKWKGPHDSFWMGNTTGGLWCEFRGGDYHGPLLNLYHPEHPESWNNDGKGGFKIASTSVAKKAIVYSGARKLKKGEELTFEWAFLMTPVKKINYESQFLDRYYHRGDKPRPTEADFEAGVKIINVHHANEYNPHINYPFVAVDEMKGFVEEMHAKGQKVKIYNTVRELTNYTTELWALRSLGHEILGDGQGGGFPWLREHLVDGYRPQWYQYFPDKSADASIVNAPGDSRWYNYYIEGLAWLVKHVDIDGLYLDDVSYDRRIVKRMRKVLDEEKPGCILDLHSNTGFSKGPATQYAEYFPYLDKLWFGESFHYDEMSPANWLVEVSGIPFGLMGDMLHRGGNRWLGMLFGMTVRHPWMTDGIICDPRPVWKVWDEFGIHQSKMIGFWEGEVPVVTSDEEHVKVTAYLKEDKVLLSLGNFSDKKQKVTLKINWEQVGLDQQKVKVIMPAIQDFQDAETIDLGDIIEVEARQGKLIVLEY